MITLAGSARDFVSWYEQALAGAFFTKPETLTEFKRIQAMSVQIAQAVPPDTPAYAKGGELAVGPGSTPRASPGRSWSAARGATPVTFCFIVNWDGPGERVSRGRSRVLRGHQRHPKGYKAGLAVTGARDFLRRPQTRRVPP